MVSLSILGNLGWIRPLPQYHRAVAVPHRGTCRFLTVLRVHFLSLQLRTNSTPGDLIATYRYRSRRINQLPGKCVALSPQMQFCLLGQDFLQQRCPQKSS